MFLAACPHTLGFTVSDVSSYNMHFLSECQLDLWPPCSPGWHFCRFCKCMTSGNPINLYVWPLSVWGCPSWAVSEVPPIPNVYDVFKLMNLRREPCISVFTTPYQCVHTMFKNGVILNLLFRHALLFWTVSVLQEKMAVYLNSKCVLLSHIIIIIIIFF